MLQSSSFITDRKSRRPNITSVNSEFSDDDTEITFKDTDLLIKPPVNQPSTPKHVRECTNELVALQLSTPTSPLKNDYYNKVVVPATPMFVNHFTSLSENIESEGMDLSFEDSDEDTHEQETQPLKDSIIYVDVRAENENRSKAISRELEKLGANIADKITNLTTHVVYKDGRQGTLTQLKKFPNIHFVSVLWVDSCKTTKCKVNEGLFQPKLNGDDSPLPIARSKRVKSLQPKTFEIDVNNSAKKEDRKKRRLKKLQSNDDNTPSRDDDILCFDSQEYIKSSDLYKMVATPRVIPDTPWIFNYINGGDRDDQTTSPSVFNEATSSKSDDDECGVVLHESIPCKLDFNVDKPELNSKDNIQKFIHPGEKVKNSLTKKKKSKVAFARQSLCSTTLQYMNKSPDNSIIDNETLGDSLKDSFLRREDKERNIEQKESKSYKPPADSMRSLDNLHPPMDHIANKITTHVDEKNINFSKETKRTTGNIDNIPELKSGIVVTANNNATVENSVASVCNTDTTQFTLLNEKNTDITQLASLKDEIPKRKKKLLGKTPKEKLGSPALQEIDIMKSNELGKQTARKYGTTSTSSLELQALDSHALINAVSNSRKIDNKSWMKANKSKDTSNTDTSSSNVFTSVNSAYLTKNSMEVKKSYKETSSSNNSIEVKKSCKETSSSNNSIKKKKSCKEISTFCSEETVDVTSVSMLSAAYSPIIKTKNKMFNFDENEEVLLQQKLANKSERRASDRIKNRRSSGIDFKCMKTYRNGSSKLITSTNRSLTASEDVIEKDCVSNNDNKKIKEDGVRNDDEDEIKEDDVSNDDEDELEEVSLTSAEEDLNVSFVHDETEGLICISSQQNTNEVKGKTNHEKLNGVEDEGNGNVVVKQLEVDANLHTHDIDSGISDSEEIIRHNTPVKEKKTKSVKVKSKLSSAVKSDVATKNYSSNKTNTSKVHMKKPKVSLVATSLHFGEQEFVKGVLKQLGGFTLRHNVSHDTTHIVAGNHRRTLNLLHGIVKGCWIITPKWLSDSYEQGEWLNEEDYEMHEDFPVAKVARLSRTKGEKRFHAQLFVRLPCIYLAEVTCPPNEELVKMIVSCGGQITTSLRKAGIAIGLVTSRRNDMQVLSEKWVLDSLTNGRIMPTKEYKINYHPQRRDASPCF